MLLELFRDSGKTIKLCLDTLYYRRLMRDVCVTCVRVDSPHTTETPAGGSCCSGHGPRWAGAQNVMNMSITYYLWSHFNSFQLSETLRKCLQSWLEGRQTSLLLWDWRSEERWVSDGDFIATSTSQNRSTPFKSYYSLLLTHTKGDYFDKQAPIYDSLVLRFWFIPDKNKYWTKL